MAPLKTAAIGTTGLRVTTLGLGGAPLGGSFARVTEDAALRTVSRALDLGVRYFDTAPLYGHGKSEGLFGRGLARAQRDTFVLSSKVGRVLNPTTAKVDAGTWIDPLPYEAVFDFSRDGVVRSLEESLRRLDMDGIDIALIHDPDDHHDQAISEAFPALAELRSQGVIRAIGAGMNQWEALARFAVEGDFDCFLLAGRYTLLDQSALAELLPLWDLERFDYEWMPPEPSVLRRSYLPKDLRPVLGRNGVERTVLVQAHASVEEAEFLLTLATGADFVAGVVAWVDLISPDVGASLDRLSRMGPLVGIRHLVETDPDEAWLSRDASIRGLREVARRGLAYDLLVKPPHLRHVPQLAERVPELRMVLDHIAKPLIASGEVEPWASDIAAVAAIPGVYARCPGW